MRGPARGHAAATARLPLGELRSILERAADTPPGVLADELREAAKGRDDVLALADSWRFAAIACIDEDFLARSLAARGSSHADLMSLSNDGLLVSKRFADHLAAYGATGFFLVEVLRVHWPQFWPRPASMTPAG